MSDIAKICIAMVVAIAVVGSIAYIKQGSPQPNATTKNTIVYLPLGDSYTIGQSVEERERWPNQLVERFKADGKQLSIAVNPARTGNTTQDLIDRQLPLVDIRKPDFVSILIGVNDYVQGVPYETFASRFEQIVTYVQDNLKQPNNIVLVTIPDYSLTPAGAQYGNPQQASAAIQKFNEHIIATGKARGLPVADIFQISQGVTADKDLIADDGLHPSGKQYTLWTEQIYKVLTAAGLPAAKL